MMRSINRTSSFIVSLAVMGLCPSALSFSPAQDPLCQTADYKPMTMLIMGRDHTLHYDAYNNAVDLDGDGQLDTGFDPSVTYYGYFDPDICYEYSSSQFEPAAAAVGLLHTCSSQWSGNYLNYVTMTRLDVVRKVLFGGKRSTDTATETVLERADIPRDSHVWARQYPNTNETLADASYKISEYTPFTEPAAEGQYHLFGSVGKQLWVRLNDTMTGQEWASQERNSILSPEPAADKKYNVNVKVCIDLDPGCQAYTGVNKPVGVLQTVGIAKDMKFGLITGSYDQNLSGGVLRKNVSDLNDEVNSVTGQFIAPVGGNIIDNINRFKINGFHGSEYDCGWVVGEPGTADGMKDGVCQDWGNPIGEMIYESLRYYAGAAAATPSFIANTTNDDAVGLSTGVAWEDPFDDGGSFNTCVRPYNLVLSDLYPSYDGDSIPGSAFPTSFTGSDLSPDMTSLLDTVTTEEGIGGRYYIGEAQDAVSGTDDDDSKYNPTAKNVSSLAQIRGLAPFYAVEQGSYSSVAMAYWGRINDLRAESGDQSVQTMIVALASPLPEFRFTFESGGASKEVTVVPFGKSPKSGDKPISPDKGEYQPTNAILDFYVLDQNDDGVPTQVQVTFDDAAQGADHDLDVTIEYQFYTSDNNGDVIPTIDPDDDAAATETLNLADNELRIDTKVVYSGEDVTTQHLGYIIDGTSSMTTHLTSNLMSCGTISAAAEVGYVDIGDPEQDPSHWFLSSSANGWTAEEMYIEREMERWYLYKWFDATDALKVRPNSFDWDNALGDSTNTGDSGNKAITEGEGCYKVSIPSVVADQHEGNLWVEKSNQFTTEASCVTRAYGINLPHGSYVLRDVAADKYYEMEKEADGTTYTAHMEVNSGFVYEILPVYHNVLGSLESGKDGVQSDERGSSTKFYAFKYRTHYNNNNIGIYLAETPPAGEDYPALSSRTSDGIYLEVSDKGVGANKSPSVAYYLDTHRGEHSSPDNRLWKCGTSWGGKLNSWNSRVFQVDVASTTKTASVLKSPLWYAAKWGGFSENEQNENNKPNLTAEWDSDSDGEPDNYWLVANATLLPQKLTEAIKSIADSSGTSQSGLAVSSGSVQDSTLVFKASYETVGWSGDIKAIPIMRNANTVSVEQPEWYAREQLLDQFGNDSQVAERLILTMNQSGAASLYNNAEFGDGSSATEDLINYIRGSAANEVASGGSFRDRKTTINEIETRYILGDIVNGSPVLSGKPSYFFNEPGYAEYYESYKLRTPVLLFGANDGMFHALRAIKDEDEGGRELFAYIPGQMHRIEDGASYLSQLADPGYKNAHRYFVDGNILVADAYGQRATEADSSWHTIAIGSLGGGGQGYFALDITDPDPTDSDVLTGSLNSFTGNAKTPVMWERSDMGYVYGKASFGKIKVGGEDKWVAILPSGYGSTQSPKLYIVDMFTGQDIDVVSGSGVTLDTANATNNSSCPVTSTNNGLSEAEFLVVDGYVKYVYAGDLQGHMWKFDLSDTSNATVSCLFKASGTGVDAEANAISTVQPITVAPTIGFAPGTLDGHMIYFGTGKYLENVDPTNTDEQSFYAVLDTHPSVMQLVNKTELVEQTITESGSPRVRAISNNYVNYGEATTEMPDGNKRGFYLDFPTDGERSIVKSTIFRRKINVATLESGSSTSCESGCGGWYMSLDLYTGQNYDNPPTECSDFVSSSVNLLTDDYLLEVTNCKAKWDERDGIVDPDNPNDPDNPENLPPSDPNCEVNCDDLRVEYDSDDLNIEASNNQDGRLNWRHLFW